MARARPRRYPSSQGWLARARGSAIGAPAYTRMMADIESRIAALPLYR